MPKQVSEETEVRAFSDQSQSPDTEIDRSHVAVYIGLLEISKRHKGPRVTQINDQDYLSICTYYITFGNILKLSSLI